MPNLTQYRREMKSQGNKAKHAMDKYTPFAIKKAFVEDNYDTALAQLKSEIEGGPPCKHCDRRGRPAPYAIRAWLEAAGAVGSMQQIVVHMNQSLGVSDEHELKELVESGKKLRDMADTDNVNMADYMADAVECLKLVFVEHPEWRAGVLKDLSSGAEVVD